MLVQEEGLAKAFIIAGIGSGCGKTTITSAIIQGLVDRGYTVQPFKVGPDYIDPAHHSVLAGRSCRNLDCWMMGEEGVRKNFKKGIAGADVAVVEGVGGLYDGLGTAEFASTAYVAKILDIPIVLVVDAWGISRTAAALIKGIMEFEDVEVVGVIFNFLGSQGHYHLLKEVMQRHLPQVKILGGVIRSKKGFVPERHLGIIQADEIDWEERRMVLREIASQVDLDVLLDVACEKEGEAFRKKAVSVAKVAVARDKAFSFLYTENIETLEEEGGEILFFSPLKGESIPSDTCSLFLPGGYPELFMDELMENTGFLKDLNDFVDSGGKIYAECGGLIFLAREIVYQGRILKGAGILPIRVSFLERPILGYAEGRILCENPFLDKGAVVRGHVFHYSQVQELEPVSSAYELFVPSKGLRLKEGFIKRGILATYLHTNWFAGKARDIAKALIS